MKKVIHNLFTGLLALFCCTGSAKETISLHQFPYRKIGQQVYNLTPRFNWDNQSGPAPLPNWNIHTGKVSDIDLKSGTFILRHTEYYTVHDKTFFVTNYPAILSLVDDDDLTFYAVNTGGIHFRSGATLDLLDFGQVLTPEQFKKYLENKDKTRSPKESGP